MRYLKTGVGLGQAVTVAFLVTYGGSTPRADASCGATIVDDLRLEHDLACVGDGLAVGADRIRIDLNGHMLAAGGPGRGSPLRDGPTLRSAAASSQASPWESG